MTVAAYLLALSAPALSAAAPDQCEAISTINVIEVQPGMTRQARAYYQQGWAAAREVAVKRGVIDSYNLLVSQSGVSDEPEIILITNYSDRAQFEASEDRFQAIFKELDLPRPLLLDGLGRDQILGPVEGADDYRSVYSSDGDCGVPGHALGG